MPKRSLSPRRPANRRVWIAISVAAAAVFVVGFLAAGDAGDRSGPGFVDRAVQAWVLAHQHRIAERFFHYVTNVGSPSGMWVLAVLGAVYLWFRTSRYTAGLVFVAPAITIALLDRVKLMYARPRPAGLTTGTASSYSFPSAHATTSAAVCCTLAFAFWREGLIDTTTALALGITPPLLVGASRLYLNRHWTTDVLGGWSAGLLVAVFASFLYAFSDERKIEGGPS